MVFIVCDLFNPVNSFFGKMSFEKVLILNKTQALSSLVK